MACEACASAASASRASRPSGLGDRSRSALRNRSDALSKSAARVKREFLGVKNYAMRRLAWILVHTAVLRTLFFAYLKASGRGGYVRYFKEERV